VLAMTPSSSHTFFFPRECGPPVPCQVGFGEAPKPAREGACAPQTTADLLSIQVIQRTSPECLMEILTGILEPTGEGVVADGRAGTIGIERFVVMQTGAAADI